MEREFQETDLTNGWNAVYGDIRSDSPVLSNKIAKYPENKNRNRYRDVYPFDHNRVKLQNMENDYINASLVVLEEAQRSYILTQGPLPDTCCHFWLMVWQQKSKAVVMLNRIIEKGTIKCAQYWPTREEGIMPFLEAGLLVKFLSEDIKSYYTVRLLQLENIRMGKRKDPSSVDIKQVLLDMRRYRMGLIQTPGQLRFSYLAVIEGAKGMKGDSDLERWNELSKEDHGPSPEHLRQSGDRYNGNNVCLDESEQTLDKRTNMELPDKVQDVVAGNTDSTMRKRLREDRKTNTALKLQQMKQKLSDAERKRKRWLYWKPIVLMLGFTTVFVVGSFACWKIYFQGRSL
uniref:protein-tyrosine-phosphatase n=1 Tax=Geotrypetes seraphini TaxID=260995 RepID=A0A6P8PNV9_GEOSA|nr:tyrosine-protein phosphatase non-receptor type 2 isoform X5 [Geotrypetes seraphini]